MSEEEKIGKFTDLDTWKEGHRLVVMIYNNSRFLPENERFGLTSQLQRAAVSVTSNVAEGFSWRSYKEKIQFYTMARGSLTEVQNLLLITRDVGYLEEKRLALLNAQTVVVHKLVNGLITSSKRYV